MPPARGAAPPAAANTRRFVLVGCVSREGTAPNQRFLITDSRGDKPIVYRLEGDVNELSFHVGHTIDLDASVRADTGDGTADRNVYTDGTPVQVRRNG